MRYILSAFFCLFASCFAIYGESLPCHAVLPEKVLICGVCKDVESRLPRSIQIMEKIGALFTDYRIIVYENNSKDKTPSILKSWKKRNSKVYVHSEKLSKVDLYKSSVNHSRKKGIYIAEAIAKARNKVLEIIEDSQFDDYPYLIWIDMDFVIEPDYGGITEIFCSDQAWDAVFAYGIDPVNNHWDWYAFRDSRCPLGSESLGNDWWYLPKKLHLSKQDPWYPVYSAFGGCGIYRREAIRGCKYSGIVNHELAQWVNTILTSPSYHSHSIIKKYKRDIAKLKHRLHIGKPHWRLQEIKGKSIGILLEDDPYQNIWRMSSFVYRYPSVCEHVSFHAAMINRGYNKLFINPRLIFRYGG